MRRLRPFGEAQSAESAVNTLGGNKTTETAVDGVEIALCDVPETLLLPLWGRAQLCLAGSPVLSDQQAVEIIRRLKYDFSRLQATLDYSKNISWAARARQFDEKIRAFLARHPAGTVVNLGAGLDTTFARVDNGRVRWIDLDLPEVIALRRHVIPETERSRCLAASLLDDAWMGQDLGDRTALLFVAGGVLCYFRQDEAMSLLRRMGTAFPGAEIVFDAISPRGAEKANAMLRQAGMEAAVIQWALKDARALDQWGANLTLVEQFEYFRGLRLGKIPTSTRLMIWANRLLRVMTIVHCRWR